MRPLRLVFSPPREFLRTSVIRRCSLLTSSFSTSTDKDKKSQIIGGKEFSIDEKTNVTPHILNFLNRNIHLQKNHPLSLIRQRIVNHFYSYKNYRGNPLFSVYDQLSPVVTLKQNFDTLLVPEDHVSRKKSDSYYINSEWMLRAHTSAHQAELIQMGLDNFLVIGDVYRRDQIDATHHPVFHQIEGVRLMDVNEMRDSWQRKLTISSKSSNESIQDLKVFDNSPETDFKQGGHSVDAAKFLELDLKQCLLDMSKALFGKGIEYRWVDAYFPFTHPSWELEIFSTQSEQWVEVLGCGIVRQDILKNCGAPEKVGWAFGVGLERLAMRLYQIPDIRLFWSKDSGFLNQFVTDDVNSNIIYRPISKFPQCVNDISFWLPENATEDMFDKNDFYDLVRNVCGDLVEQVVIFDEFYHPKKKRLSQSYRITYRSHEKTLTQEEVCLLHKKIADASVHAFGVSIR